MLIVRQWSFIHRSQRVSATHMPIKSVSLKYTKIKEQDSMLIALITGYDLLSFGAYSAIMTLASLG